MKAYDQGSANLIESHLCVILAFANDPAMQKKSIEEIYKLGFNDGRMAQRVHGFDSHPDKMLEEGGGEHTFTSRLTTTQTKEEKTCNG